MTYRSDFEVIMKVMLSVSMIGLTLRMSLQ